jgi:hypothetical protein
MISCSLPSDQINSLAEVVRNIEEEFAVKISIDYRSSESKRERVADAVYLLAAVITILAEGDVAYSKTKKAVSKIVSWLQSKGIKSSVS